MVDIATRVFNQNWKIDPIVRSLIDTDFYKILMSQFIFQYKRDVVVKFQLINRSKKVGLADLIDESELREQLDQARSLRLSRGEATWLRGNQFYGKNMMFKPEFISWLENFSLPAYCLKKEDNNYELSFEGSWHEVSLWEIPALSIVSELRSRALLKNMAQ